jgi:putative oxidoreductase
MNMRIIGAGWKYAPVKGRVLLSLLFIILGAGKLMGFSGFVGYVESFGIPAATAVAALVVAIEVLGGLALLLGFHARIAAWVLGLFVFATILVAHRDIGDQAQLTQALKNFAIIGGLVYVAKYGSGPWSLAKSDACGCCNDGNCSCDTCPSKTDTPAPQM